MLIVPIGRDLDDSLLEGDLKGTGVNAVKNGRRKGTFQ
jgi:hypothetical protein